MTVTPDSILLNAGTHNMGDRDRAPKKLQKLHKKKYSLHHILPYRYPLFIGFLVSKYHTSMIATDLRSHWPSSTDKDLLARKVEKLLSVLAQFDLNRNDLFTRFAWMGPNLFQGPSGNLRLDDPGSEWETNKPCSMDQEVWDLLLELGKRVDQLAEWGHNNGDYEVTTKREITVRDLDDLLTTMMSLANRGHGNALGFKADDWLCLTSSAPEYQMTPTNQITGGFKHQFKLLIRSKPHQIIVRKPGDDGQPVNTVLWRLRLAEEEVPNDAVPAPRLKA